MQIVVPTVAALAGIVVGAFLSRRNARKDHADRLLAEALNDLVAAVADVAGKRGSDALARYGAAKARIALHGSGDLVRALKGFSHDPETSSADGRRRFLAVLQAGRRELKRPVVDEDAASIVLFGVDDRTGSRGT